MGYWGHELVLERRSLKLRLLFSLFAREEGLLPPGLCYDARLSSGKCSKCAREGGHTAVQGYPALGFSSFTVSDS